MKALLLDFLWYLPTRASKQKYPVSLKYRRDDNFEGDILGIKEYLPQPPGRETKGSFTLTQLLPSAHRPQERPRGKACGRRPPVSPGGAVQCSAWPQLPPAPLGPPRRGSKARKAQVHGAA